MLVKYDEQTGEVTPQPNNMYNLGQYIHDLNDIEDSFSIGLYKILFIISACISAIM